MSEEFDIRWLQRFTNFKRAFYLLKEIVDQNDDLTLLEPIVKEGVIQRFQYTFELAWKTLKDKMEYDGLVIERISPKHVFKLAYQSKYIDCIEEWLQMVNDRNLMSHTYDFESFDRILLVLKNTYFSLLETLYRDFSDENKGDK